jgi:hypothetical protein
LSVDISAETKVFIIENNNNMGGRSVTAQRHTTPFLQYFVQFFLMAAVSL